MKVFRAFSLLLLTLVFVASANAAGPRYRGFDVSSNISPSDISDLATLNPSLIRINLIFEGSVDTANEAEYNVWLDSTLVRVDQFLEIAGQTGTKAVINLYSPPGGFASIETPSWHRVFKEAWAQEAIVRAWQKIATRYKDNPNVWAYDILNEPAQRSVSAGLKDWNGLALELVQAIRVIDTTHKIIIEPLYGSTDKLAKLKPIKNVKGIVYSIHSYYPQKFIHQGLYGYKDGLAYPSKKLNKRVLKSKLQKVITFQQKNKAEIFIGEFAAVRWAPGKSTYNYIRDSIAIFESLKWHWNYHAWRDDNAWSVEHSTTRADTNKVEGLTDRALLLKAYFGKNRSTKK